MIQDWFSKRFPHPTEPQVAGWPSIVAGEPTLIAAPTGSGKTLTAFLGIIDRLFRQSAEGELNAGLQVVYISPLRALSNDMQRNLTGPLAGIQETAQEWGLETAPIRIGLRTGDSTPYERAQLVKKPPHILVTTPESLYLMLTSEKSRETLRTVNTVIIDEIHAMVRDKRGSHLSLSLERLEAVVDQPIQRIGLSATQRPIERMANFLIGCRDERSRDHIHGDKNDIHFSTVSTNDEPVESVDDKQIPDCRIIDVGHTRELDLGIETPPGEMQAVCSHEQWAAVHERLVELINTHRSTLIFVNTRRMAERLTHQLSQHLGEDAIGSHHGSLSKEIRHRTEKKLKEGEFKAVVATSSLELGIDVGTIDLVIQIGSPRSIAVFLQRIGRSGHALGLIPKGRLLALTRDEAVECMALVRAIQGKRLDITPIPEAPLDILAQQIVAETAAQEWSAEELYHQFRKAWPYRDLSWGVYEQTLRMMSEGLTENHSRGQALIYYDRINGKIKGRRAARLVALSNGGAIGETDTVRVVLEDENTVVGSVDEEFAVESSAGDIFLLGNTSWRIRRLRGNDLIVADAEGAPPSIPFWQGEAPGRTLELSEEVSALREEVEKRLIAADQNSGSAPSETNVNPDRPAKWKPLADWLQEETCCYEETAWQIIIYMAAQRAAVGFLPTQSRILFERFFDESGGMQLVVHAPFGTRINRGWGLAFRKRFCRSFDFELQATADDDGFILSLGPQHSFPLESMFPMMRSDNIHNLLEQALLAVPMFQVRWRWNITRALFVSRMKNGKKVPPALQRFRSEDLLTAVFPKLTGCQENITGDHEIPDHPLVQQTMNDCLYEALDLDEIKHVFERVEAGEFTLIGRDTREPSPFAYELLNSNPYAFLDGGEVQERRARAVATRRSLNIESLSDLGRLDPAAIQSVVQEAQPLIRDADELHDLLQSRFVVPVANKGEPENPLALSHDHDFLSFFKTLQSEGRAGALQLQPGQQAWYAMERWPMIQAALPHAQPVEEIELPSAMQQTCDATESLIAILRGWLETTGPITADKLAAALGLTVDRVAACLEAIEGEGLILRGRFTPESLVESNEASPVQEWCHRRLLARIHRRTITGLRKEIEAVDPSVYMHYLSQHQGVAPGFHKQGADGLYEVISQLQGIDLAAGAWEPHVLLSRVEGYRPEWLDELSLSGDAGWGRLSPVAQRKSNARPMASMTKSIPVSIFLREDFETLTYRRSLPSEEGISLSAKDVLDLLKQEKALFSSDITQRLQLLPSQLEELLGELVAAGWVTADGFAGLRQMIRNLQETQRKDLPTRYRRVRQRTQSLGRWTLLPLAQEPAENSRASDEEVEEWAWQLIRRWGIVFRDLAVREPLAPQWWELLRAYRRLEARGELRGGRFVRGVGGEQFATSEAIRELRAVRQQEQPAPVLSISGADPLNLTGIVGGGNRIPALTAHRVAYQAGHVVGWKKGEDFWISHRLPIEDQKRLSTLWSVPLQTTPAFSIPNGVPPAFPVAELPAAHEGKRKTSASTRSRKKRSSYQPPSGIPRPFPF